MDGEKQKRWQRITLSLLILHIAFFLMAWAYALYRAINITWLAEWRTFAYIPEYQTPLLVALIWFPLMLIHVCAYLYLRGGANAGATERQVYREGFTDGARYSASEVYDMRHLAIDEDGELIEWEDKRKREER